MILHFHDAHLFDCWEPEGIFRACSKRRWYYNSCLIDEGLRHLETEVILVCFGGITWNETWIQPITVKVLQWVPLLLVLMPLVWLPGYKNLLNKLQTGLLWHRPLYYVSCHSISVTLKYTVQKPLCFLNLLFHLLFIFHLLQQVKQKSYEHPSVNFN